MDLFFSTYGESYNKAIIAFSGGSDSLVLLDQISKIILPKNIILAHVNYGVSKESGKWETLSKKYAEEYGVEFKILRLGSETHTGNFENWARDKRYSFFESLMSEGDVVFTGHHANDQAETIILKLIRGAGIDGISGIKPVRVFGKGKLIRPLINACKDDIYSYAKGISKYGWAEDPSNLDSRYDRNFIRNEILPMISNRWPAALSGISKSARNLQETKTIVDMSVGVSVGTCSGLSYGFPYLDIDVLLKYCYAIQKSILKKWLNDNSVLMTNKMVNYTFNELINSKNYGSLFQGKNFQIRKDSFKKNGKKINCLFLTKLDKEYNYKDIINESKLESAKKNTIPLTLNYSMKSTLRVGENKKTLSNICQENGIPLFIRCALPVRIDNGQVVELFIPHLENNGFNRMISTS
jgi:tRNA(Ile)-lysidine synthetase-like protein